MSHFTDVPPNLDLHCLAEAVAELVTSDLDDLYGQRMRNPRAYVDGPGRDAAAAANNIAYLSSQLLPEIIRYQSSMIRMREEQARRQRKAERSPRDEDIPF
jgi:hypothetical protein